jgi:hypothetical protein
MGKYVLAYTGGAMGETEADQQAVMEAWMSWFSALGPAIVDPGNPFGQSSAVAPGGTVTAAGTGLTGYSVISADGLVAATEVAKGCPVLAAGGTVEVYETIDVM